MCGETRRDFITRAAASLAAVTAGASSHAADGSAAAASGAKRWRCPPCGCSMDGVVFERPGTCPACGMRLIEASARPEEAPSAGSRPRVAILVFDGVEIIDFAAPYEVFGEAGYDVFTVAPAKLPVRTFMDLVVTPRFSIDEVHDSEVLLTPGGDIHPTASDARVLEWIRTLSARTRCTISVCNGAFFLANAGLLRGLEATTYYGLIERLASEHPEVTVVSDRRFVDNGRVITTAGLSSGIDGALHVVAKLSGRGAAQMVALNMEYDWKEDGRYARASFADLPIRRIFGSGLDLDLPAPSHATVESTAGDTRSWETRWLVRTDRNASALLQAIGATIASRSDWKVARDRAADEHEWTFHDREHRAWRARLRVSPMDSPRTLRASLSVQRS